MALASGSPTQIGSERLSSSSRRTIIGMLESGSSARSLHLHLEPHGVPPPRAAPTGSASAPAQAVRQRLGDRARARPCPSRSRPRASKFTTRLQRVRPDRLARVLARAPRPRGPAARGPRGAGSARRRTRSRDLEQRGVALGLHLVGHLIRHVRRRACPAGASSGTRRRCRSRRARPSSTVSREVRVRLARESPR